MKYKNVIYKELQKFVKDKDAAVNSLVRNALDRLQTMFVWHGLPETIPPRELENILQVNGAAFVTDQTGAGLYAFGGGFGGETDAYYRPTIFTVANPALNISRNYVIETDGVLIKNDTHTAGVMPILGKYAVLLADCEISLNTAAVLSRFTTMISAGDDTTKAGADLFVKKLLDGEFTVIGESAFFDGVKVHSAAKDYNSITQLVELMQYYKATFLNEIGLQANYNMKRERLNTAEVGMNVDYLLPLVDDMLQERRDAAARMSEKYGLSVTVELGSAWKTIKDESDTVTVAAGVLENELKDGEQEQEQKNNKDYDNI